MAHFTDILAIHAKRSPTGSTLPEFRAPAKKPFTDRQAADLIRDHGNQPSEFWVARDVALGRVTLADAERDHPELDLGWAVGCQWMQGPVTRRMVLSWLGY